ncbi:hypothetical protein FRB95_006729 [Tulasnella sp. JGI-2019a]|nr:hypothetical protein FRB93_005413 [Tulasnella sp. JGI-2019a]KAG9028228.1 hypothetical protein FRB95_006729 [Tulasnella sp. JGI-2019a]
MLEIFHESKDFFTLKDLEKLGPKLKGIVSQSVKEVVQSLVDDNLICSDKIGTSNFFWCFPSARGATLNAKATGLKETTLGLQIAASELRDTIKAEKAERLLTPERQAGLARHAELQSKIAALNREQEQYGASNPVQVNLKRRAITLAQEAATRHTDNTLAVISYFAQKGGIDSKDFRTHLGIAEDWDDI